MNDDESYNYILIIPNTIELENSYMKINFKAIIDNDRTFIYVLE